MMSKITPGEAISAMSEYVAQARHFHARVDALAEVLSGTEPHNLAARDHCIAELAKLVKRFAPVIQ